MILLLLATAIATAEPSAATINSTLAYLDHRIDDGLVVCLRINGSDPSEKQLPPPDSRTDVFPASQCRYINHQMQAPNGKMAALLSLDNFQIISDKSATIDANLLYVSRENYGTWSISFKRIGKKWEAISDIPNIDY